jgi:hypothetical protein
VVEKPNKFQCALIPGLIFGLLSAIPIVKLANLCCCLWAVVGGALAARTMVKRSPVLPVSSGDGAGAGAISGVIVALINLVIGVPLDLLTGDLMIGVFRYLAEQASDPNMRSAIEQAIQQQEGQPFAQQVGTAVVWWLVFAALAIGFATLGGVIGVAMFEKRKGQAPPPAPGQAPYGGQPGGYPPPPGQAP